MVFPLLPAGPEREIVVAVWVGSELAWALGLMLDEEIEVEDRKAERLRSVLSTLRYPAG